MAFITPDFFNKKAQKKAVDFTLQPVLLSSIFNHF